VIRRLAKGDETMRRFMTLPGVGLVVSLAPLAMIADPERFSRARDVGAYLGLTPKRYQSGEVDLAGRIHMGGVPGQCEAPGRHKQERRDISDPSGGRRSLDWLRPRRGGYAAISKAAISVAADLRDTLAAGARGAS
jgi:hypothetical protein